MFPLTKILFFKKHYVPGTGVTNIQDEGKEERHAGN